MKNNIEYIDNKIRELADFKPKVEPDWESFFAKNQHELEGLKAGTGKTSLTKGVASSAFKYSIIVISVIALFIAGFYFFGSEDKLQNNPNEKLPEIQINTPREVIVPAQSSDGNASESLQSKETLPVETMKNSILEATEQNSQMPATIIEEKREDNIQKDQPSNSGSTSDSMIDKPVIIRKTVIIDDTLRIKRPSGK